MGQRGGPDYSQSVTFPAPTETSKQATPEVEVPCADLVPQPIGDGITGVLPLGALLVSGEQTTGYDNAPAVTSRNFDVHGVAVSIGRRFESSVSNESGSDERADGDVVLFVKTDDPILRACIADSLVYDSVLDAQD